MIQTAIGPLVNDLRGVVEQTLGNLLPPGEACALLDFPDHPNVGDSAIWLGERAYLARRGVRVAYICDALTYSEDRLRSRVAGGPILIHGGGNLGDLWPRHQALREAVVRAFPRNRIIQLPQTIWFRDHQNLARTRAVFNHHPDLTLLVRDPPSLDIARNNFKAKSLLCPDMAFALGSLPRAGDPVRDVVWLLRQDVESAGHPSAPTGLKAMPVDWVADQRSMRLWLERFLVDQHCRHPRVSDLVAPLLSPLYQDLWDGLARERVQRGCALLSSGKVLVTDRLHGHILSLLLGIPHVVLDNSYGKVSSFYETWTRASSLARWARTHDEAAELANELLGNGA